MSVTIKALPMLEQYRFKCHKLKKNRYNTNYRVFFRILKYALFINTRCSIPTTI